MRPPAVSVVVVTRNREARLRALIASLRAQSFPADRFEVVVIDDGSTDGTPGVLATEADSGDPKIRALRVEDRPGLAALRNRGWLTCEGETIAFIDDDCEADPAWLEELVAAVSGGAAVQGRTVPIDAELDREGPLSRTKRIERAGPWFQTCNIAYPRSLLAELGGFDETFAIAGEDTDLGWRAIARGARVEFAARAVARHAVEDIGFRGWLRIAARERTLAPLFRRHRPLREEVAVAGVFKDREKALFALAALSLAAGTRFRPALLGALPYARLLTARCRATSAGPQWAAWFAAYDAVAAAQSLRGAVESRTPLV